MDLATLQRKDVQFKMEKMSSYLIGDIVWEKFVDIVTQILVFVEIISRGLFLLEFFGHQENGWMLVAVCVLSPMVTMLAQTSHFGGGKSTFDYCHLLFIPHSVVRIRIQQAVYSFVRLGEYGTP